MKGTIIFLLLTTFSLLFSSTSLIIEVEGTASMGGDKSRKETISAAKEDAKRNAIENASTYIRSETVVKDYTLEKDLIEAYSQATVKVLEIISGKFFNDDVMGESYKIKIKVEVKPNANRFKSLSNNSAIFEDPTAPLVIKGWTDKEENIYKKGEKIKIYLKGNKPFYARVIYKQLDNSQIQILPNPYKKDNYFNGGTVYILPSGIDEYELEVAAPFGKEQILIFASTEQLGELNLTNAGSLYVVNDNSKDAGIKVRGVKLQKKESSSGKFKSIPAEFFNLVLEINTEK